MKFLLIVVMMISAIFTLNDVEPKSLYQSLWFISAVCLARG